MPGGIKDWPEDERLKRGPEALTDAELLALILRTGDAASRQSALDIGRELLREFGDLRSLAVASTADLCRLKGTGPAKAACLKAALELAKHQEILAKSPGAASGPTCACERPQCVTGRVSCPRKRGSFQMYGFSGGVVRSATTRGAS